MNRSALSIACICAGVILLITGLHGWAQPCNTFKQSVNRQLTEFHVRDWDRCEQMAGVFSMPIFTNDTAPLSQSMSNRLNWIKAKTILGISFGPILILSGFYLFVRAADAPLTFKPAATLSACLLGSALFLVITFSIYLEKLNTLEWRKGVEPPSGYVVQDSSHRVSQDAIQRQLFLLWGGGMSCLALTCWVALRTRKAT